jgi:molecular chaperone GrpE
MAEETAEPTPPTPPGKPPAQESPPPEEDWAIRYRYLLAEFDNYRKRSERERESVSRVAEARLLRAILPVYESFVNARSAAEKGLAAGDPIRKGLRLLAAEWNAFLDTQGIDFVVRPGMQFRPDEQEAVGEAPASKEHPAGSVVEVVQQGFRFPGGLLRPAKVIVARAPPPPEKPPVTPSSSSSAAEPSPSE